MAFPDVKPGQFSTLVCASSTFTAEITDMKFSGEKYESIDVTKLSSTAREFIQSPIYDAGELDLTIHHSPDNRYPVSVTQETFTILYPPIGTATGNTQRARIAFVGFLLEQPHTIPLSAKLMEGSLKIKCTGGISHTATS